MMFSPKQFFLAFLTFIISILTACAVYQTPTPSPSQEPATVESVEVQPETPIPEEMPEITSKLDEEPIFATPTYSPTSMPGPIEIVISNIAESTGADRTYVFGLSVEDWANLAVSILLVLVGTLIVSRILLTLLRSAAKSSSSPWVGEFVELTKSEIRWFIGVIILQFGTNRLRFLSPGTQNILDQIYFSLYVFIITIAILKLIDLGEKWYEEQRVDRDEGGARAEAVLPLFRRTLRGILIIVSSIIILDRFGVNVTALTAALGIGGLALSLAAQDTLADMISGLIILIDQPFRVGDRIEIENLNTWGDVVDIGTRTTRIRTRDNRMVIIPNSSISKSQIVNYTYPSTQYRVQIEIGVAYKSNLEKVKEIIVDAVSGVEGVLMDKSIDALFLEFGDTSMIICVRWWIESYVDTRRMYDKVNTALKEALTEAGIEMPFTTYDVNIRRYESINDGDLKNQNTMEKK